MPADKQGDDSSDFWASLASSGDAPTPRSQDAGPPAEMPRAGPPAPVRDSAPRHDAQRSRWPAILAVVFAGFSTFLLVVMAFGWLKDWVIVRAFDSGVEAIAGLPGSGRYLAKAIMVLLMVPLLLAARELGRIPFLGATGRIPRTAAWAIFVVYLSAYFLALHFAARPRQLTIHSVEEVDFFDRHTGEPLIWYYRSPSGEIEIFSSAGFHPRTNDPLRAVDRDVVETIRIQLDRRAEADRRQAGLRQAEDVSARERERQERDAQERLRQQQEAAAVARTRQEQLAGMLGDLRPNTRAVDIAVGVLDRESGWDSTSAAIISRAITRAHPGVGLRPLRGDFRQVFAAAFGGSAAGLDLLGIPSYVDSLLLVTKTTRTEGGSGLVGVEVTLDVRLVDSRTWTPTTSFTESVQVTGDAAAARSEALSIVADRLAGRLF